MDLEFTKSLIKNDINQWHSFLLRQDYASPTYMKKRIIFFSMLFKQIQMIYSKSNLSLRVLLEDANIYVKEENDCE